MADDNTSKAGKLIQGFGMRRSQEVRAELTSELRRTIPALPNIEAIADDNAISKAVSDFHNIAIYVLPRPHGYLTHGLPHGAESMIVHLTHSFSSTTWDKGYQKTLEAHIRKAESIVELYSFPRLEKHVDATMEAVISFMHDHARNANDAQITLAFEDAWRGSAPDYDGLPLRDLYINSLLQLKLEKMGVKSR